MIRAYVYNKCSQCRDVIKAMEHAGLEVNARDFFRERFGREELLGVLDETGCTLDDIVSKRSTPYREMGLGGKSPRDEELIDLMLEEPRLIRRPIVIGQHNVLIGSKSGDVQTFIAKETRT